MYDAHNFEQVLDPDVCIYDAANFVTEGRKDGQADSRSWMLLFGVCLILFSSKKRFESECKIQGPFHL